MRFLVCVALPYANGPLHLGHIAGAYLPADIFARYHRMSGDEVLLVSGSDEHGTPITIRAEREGRSPKEIADRYHELIAHNMRQLGISFDWYTRTGTSTHQQVVQEFFTRLLEKDYIYRKKMIMPFCPHCGRFLPDRYIEGRCPHCHAEGARGDQCDRCGRLLAPGELIEPRCRICGGTPESRETEHFFFKLSAFQRPLQEWVKKQKWKKNVRQGALGLLSGGLKDRAITRDLEWGVPIPLPGYEGKRIYVWFEALIGYISATVEWATHQGAKERWKDYWCSPAQIYHFVGKDNIPFHTIMWPAMLLAHGGLNLPSDVPANEYMTLAGEKFSSSRDHAIWLPDCLDRFDPDPIRYCLTVNMPETRDTDFTWDDFIRRNNDELVATLGNFVHRTLTFAHKHWGFVPPARMDKKDRQLLDNVENAFADVAMEIERCRFKRGLKKVMDLAQAGNKYLDEQSPWHQDSERRATTIHCCLQACAGLSKLMAPFLPFAADRLWSLLGYEGSVHQQRWAWSPLQEGQHLNPPAILFKKLEKPQVGNPS